PTTTRLADTSTPLRLRLPVGTAGIDHESDVLVVQVIAVANESFRRELGVLPVDLAEALDAKLRAVMGLCSSRSSREPARDDPVAIADHPAAQLGKLARELARDLGGCERRAQGVVEVALEQ